MNCDALKRLKQRVINLEQVSKTPRIHPSLQGSKEYSEIEEGKKRIKLLENELHEQAKRNCEARDLNCQRIKEQYRLLESKDSEIKRLRKSLSDCNLRIRQLEKGMKKLLELIADKELEQACVIDLNFKEQLESKDSEIKKLKKSLSDLQEIADSRLEEIESWIQEFGKQKSEFQDLQCAVAKSFYGFKI